MTELVQQGPQLLSKPTGLHTAWLLATLGSKLNTKKSIKREILQISIPEICEELIEIGNEKNIRYSSNILYGISLLYKSKINYFLSDISLVRARLKREFFLKNFGHHDVLAGNIININQQLVNNSRSGQIFLKNDPSFDISIDLIPPFEFDEDNESNRVKRRKLEIKSYDQDIFPNSLMPINTTYMDNTYTNTQQNFTTVESPLYDNHIQTIENFMNQNIEPFNGSSEGEILSPAAGKTAKVIPSMKNDDEIDFEFNNDGEIVRLNNEQKGQETDFNNPGYDDLELGDLNEPNLNETILNNTSNKTISNDEYFHLSTTDNQATNNPQLILNKSMILRNKRSYQSLVIDQIDNLKISSKVMIKSVKNYEDRMINIKTEELISYDENELTNEILNELHSGLSPFLNYTNIIIFKNTFTKHGLKLPNLIRNGNINNSLALNSIIKEIENMTRIPNKEDEFEIGREIQRGNLIDDELINQQNDFNLTNNDFNDFDEYEDNLANQSQQDIFNLSFNELDTGEIRSRYNSKSTGRSSSIPKKSQDNNSDEDYFQEESINYTPGAPTLKTQVAKLNNQLLKFLDFIKVRNDLIGEKFQSNEIILNKIPNNSQLTLSKSLSTSTEFSKIEFSNLIPNLRTCKKINEMPINKKLAANSFSSILALSTRNLIKINIKKHEKFELLDGDKIEVVVEM